MAGDNVGQYILKDYPLPGSIYDQPDHLVKIFRIIKDEENKIFIEDLKKSMKK